MQSLGVQLPNITSSRIVVDIDTSVIDYRMIRLYWFLI